MADSVAILMQRTPKQLDGQLPDCYQKVMQLEGVQGVQETHFWTLCSNYYCGGLKIEVTANADPKYVIRYQQLRPYGNLKVEGRAVGHDQQPKILVYEDKVKFEMLIFLGVISIMKVWLPFQ